MFAKEMRKAMVVSPTRQSVVQVAHETREHGHTKPRSKRKLVGIDRQPVPAQDQTVPHTTASNTSFDGIADPMHAAVTEGGVNSSRMLTAGASLSIPALFVTIPFVMDA